MQQYRLPCSVMMKSKNEIESEKNSRDEPGTCIMIDWCSSDDDKNNFEIKIK